MFQKNTSFHHSLYWSYSRGGQAVHESVQAEEIEKMFSSQTPQDIINCWYIFAAGLPTDDCQVAIEEANQLIRNFRRSNADYLQLGRDLSVKFGRRLGSDVLFHLLNRRDESVSYIGDSLENKIDQVLRRQGQALPNSIGDLSKFEKEKLGILVVPGYGGDAGQFGQILLGMKKLLIDENYQVHIAPLRTRFNHDVNIPLFLSALDDVTKKYSQVIIVASSKGVQDLIRSIVSEDFLNAITQQQRDKIAMVISMSGVIRYSHFAHWLENSSSIKVSLLRSLLFFKMESPKTMDGLEDLSTDIWSEIPDSKTNFNYRMRNSIWLNVAVFPEGNYGSSLIDRSFHRADKMFSRKKYQTGPTDGLIETAAGVFPPGVNVEQWILRVRGSHKVFDGVLHDGLSLCGSKIEENKDYNISELTKMAARFLMNILNAVPASVLNNR